MRNNPKPENKKNPPASAEPPAANPGAQSVPGDPAADSAPPQPAGEGSDPSPDDPKFQAGYELGYAECLQHLGDELTESKSANEALKQELHELEKEFRALEARHKGLVAELQEADETEQSRPGARPIGGIAIPCRSGGTLTVPERAARELRAWLGPDRGVDAAAMYDGYFNVVSYPDGQQKSFRL